MRGGALGVCVLAGCLSGGGASAPAEAVAVDAAGPRSEPQVEAVGASASAVGVRAPGRRAPLDPVVVMCERAIRCGTIGRSQRDECMKGAGRSRLTLVWGYDDMLGIGALVEQGRLVVLAEESRACLEYLSVGPCRYDGASPLARCFADGVKAYGPGVKPGGKCERWDECAGGFCTAQPGCEGVCVATAPLGAACGANQLCGDGAFCWEGTCRARADVGETCRGHWQWCKDGLLCAGYRPGIDDDHYRSPETPGTCRGPLQRGESCVPPPTASGEVCASPLFCDWGADAPVCTEPLPEGAACRWLDACADGLACAGLVLGGRHRLGTRYGVKTAGRCARTLDAGDACDPAAFVTGCPAAMTCDAAKKVCRSTGHEGDPCASRWVTTPQPDDAPPRRESCFSGHYCDMKTRTCKRELRQGERCTPQPFGVEDEPCFLGKCGAKTRRCGDRCEE